MDFTYLVYEVTDTLHMRRHT